MPHSSINWNDSMEKVIFSAYSIADEIDIKKYYSDKFEKVWRKSWEEPLIIDYEKGRAYVFAFGTIVLENPSDNLKEDVIKEFKRYLIGKKEKQTFSTIEIILLESWKEIENLAKNIKNPVFVTEENVYMLKKSFDEETKKVIALAIAQDASLSGIEEDVEMLIDSTNEIISYLKRPAILARSGKILEYIINTTKIKTAIISDLMLIERPEIASTNQKVQKVYYSLRDFFEFRYRLGVLNTKLNYLSNLMDFASRVTYEKKTELLETLIVLLFIIDIIIYLFGGR
jgi:uncharacterized Rmd1/YagE family protein